MAARLRMPLVAISVIGFVVVAIASPGGWWYAGAVALYMCAIALYVRVGTPRGRSVDISSPVHGRWLTVNSPSTRVPSHGIHGWAQTHACDLVAEPDSDDRPPAGWWPLARRPDDYPGFGAELRSPVDGVVVRSIDAMRDHWSRTSPLGILYLIVEMVRELFGPIGILGNYLVIRSDGERDVYVAMAHLQRRSLTVRSGDRVAKGDLVARCGNSGNSTEPHLHIQVMDKASPWIAAGVPFTIDGKPLPPTDDHLHIAARDSCSHNRAGSEKHRHTCPPTVPPHDRETSPTPQRHGAR
ncbi:M23 family metallopeptidase [Ilumatobacter sp.]|uniref:M23 family metallopeptidase n=1 Tax=Ilumatobacter sp. TaxID=1967498 RepID=UPI003C59AB78